MLEQDKTDIRVARHKVTQEDFTPDVINDIMFNDKQELLKDFSKTYCDPCAGIGNMLLYVLRKRLVHCKTKYDLYNAVKTLYGNELMEDNTKEIQERMIFAVRDYAEQKRIEVSRKEYCAIYKKIKENIICGDVFDLNDTSFTK